MPTNTCRWSFGALAQKIHQIFRLVWEKLDSENRYFIGGSLLIVWWVTGSNPKIYTDTIRLRFGCMYLSKNLGNVTFFTKGPFQKEMTHFPTIDFQGILLVFKGAKKRQG